jgi:argininosuccinate lyase
MTDLIATGLDAVPDRMRAAAREGFATATDFADYLVRKGVSFRDAHEAVARAVRYAEEKGCDLADLPLAELRGFSPEVADDVFALLTPEGSVASRDHPRGTARAQVGAAIRAARAALDRA